MERVQASGGPQLDEIIRDALSKEHGGTVYAPIILKQGIRFLGTGTDWLVISESGELRIKENTGTELAPTWTTRAAFDSTGLMP